MRRLSASASLTGKFKPVNDRDERDTLTPADFLAAGVEAPNWREEPIPSLETWRLWRAAEDRAMATKRVLARAGSVVAP
jgi:hypothetical protein